MAVQQGQLTSTDTTIDMTSFYSDAVVDTLTDVDRIIHNETQFVRLVLRRPQAVSAHSASNAAGPDILVSASHYIDGQFSPSPVPTVDIIRVTFAPAQLVATTSIAIYSTQPIDTSTPGDWIVATSSDGTDTQFDLTNFKATSVAVAESTLNDTQTGGNGTQFKYTITFTAPSIGGLQYWRVYQQSIPAAFSDVTEIEIVEPLTPTISYFNTNGTFANSQSFSQSNILDAVYDNVNDIFYTIRFNTGSAGTSTISLSDDFGDADSGTATGTNNFNAGRWTESTNNTGFLRLSDELAYNVSAGKGQLETTYTLDDFTTTIEVNPQTLDDPEKWFVMRALDTSNNVLVQEGVGYETSPTATGVYFAHSIENLVDAVGTCDLKELRPLWHNTTSGTESFTVTYSGTTWAVTGTLTGALTNAQTGVLYDESVDSNTPVEFLISCTATPTTGEKFTFDLVTGDFVREPLATGTLGLARTGNDLTTAQVFLSPKTIVNTDNLTIELFGSTNGSVNIAADNYEVSVGSGTFPDVAVFTVERTDDDGDLVTGNPTVIESLDIIGDSSLTYNDFLDGRVQLAATSSGSGAGDIFIKKDNTLYKYANSVSLGSEDGSNATLSTTGQLAKDGTHSLSWSHKSSIGGIPFLSYIEYDSTLDIIHLKTLDTDSLQDTSSAKEVLLDISGYSTTQEFRVFYNQGDFDTLYYVDASNNLRAWNIDDRISAFIAVNAEDTTLPAGTAQQTNVNADVINAWGEVTVGKTVTFSVTGDGAVTPSSDTTDSVGRATTQFSVGSTVGVSTVTATVTET